MAGRITDRGAVDARQLPELLLGAPEAAHAKHGAGEAVRERRLESMTVHEMRLRHAHPRITARQRLGWQSVSLDVFDHVIGKPRLRRSSLAARMVG